MKSTGIVRRIDDLGRVVIPQDIRYRFNIKEGDPLELFEQDDYICFKKYSTAPRLIDLIEGTLQCIEDEDIWRDTPPEQVAIIKAFAEVLSTNIHKALGESYE